MRKNLFVYLFGVLCSLALFTACSDDDGNKGNGGSEDGGGQPVSLQETVVGTYDGDLTVEMNGVSLTPTPLAQRIFMKADAADKVELILRNFSISIGEAVVPVGDIIVPGVALSGDASNVELVETTITMQHESLGELPIKVKGNVASGRADLAIDVIWTNEGTQMPISVAYTGDRVTNEVLDEDYASTCAGYYPRTENGFTCDYTAEDFELEYPTSVTFEVAGYNKINIKGFKISFPIKEGFTSALQSIKADNVLLSKQVDGSLIISEYKGSNEAVEGKSEATEYSISGKLVGKELTLDIIVKSETFTVTYKYVSGLLKTENKFLGVTFDSDAIESIPAQVYEADGFVNKQSFILFYAKNVSSDRLNIIPTIEVSEGAKIIYNGTLYEAGTTMDFSKLQRIKIVSEKDYSEKGLDATGKEYTFLCSVLNFSTDFEAWEQKNITDEENMKYYEPIGGWATSNAGVEQLKTYGALAGYSKDKPYAVVEVTGNTGKAAELITIYAKPNSLMASLIPTITSGSLFNGLFWTDMSQTLKSTRFGQPCLQEPKAFTGSYTYTPGETYYNCSDPTKPGISTPDNTKTDKPAMNAVLYEVEDYTETLDGTNLLTSDKIVAIASVSDAGKQTSWTGFNVPFIYKDGKMWDASKKYKLAIVCSSSVDGDKFCGAAGSKLCLDDLKVEF